jgi:hypothetical protein
MMLALGRYGIALTFGMARQKKKNNGYNGAKEEEDKGWNPKDSPDRSELTSSAPARAAHEASLIGTYLPDAIGYGSSPDRGGVPRPVSYGTSSDRIMPDHHTEKSPDRKANGNHSPQPLKEEKPCSIAFSTR